MKNAIIFSAVILSLFTIYYASTRPSPPCVPIAQNNSPPPTLRTEFESVPDVPGWIRPMMEETTYDFLVKDPDEVGAVREAVTEFLEGPPVPAAVNVQKYGVSIRVGDGSKGSGTYMYDDTITGGVLTCSHLFDHSQSGIKVTVPGHGVFDATIVERDTVHDMAVLRLKSVGIQPARVAVKRRVGLFTAGGFGDQENLWKQDTGKIMRRTDVGGGTRTRFVKQMQHQSVVIDAVVRSGDSGGGVFNDIGELSGVIWGCVDGETYFSTCVDLQAFIDRNLAKLKSPRRAFEDLPVASSSPTFEKLLVVSSPSCGPCKLMEPHLDELADEGYHVSHIMYDEYKGGEPIHRFPTLLWFNGDTLAARSEGYQSKQQLLAKLRSK